MTCFLFKKENYFMYLSYMGARTYRAVIFNVNLLLYNKDFKL